MSATAGVGSDLRSDAELIAAARTRDAASFGALYERHAGAALVVARQHTDSAADAEDVVADSFTAVWGALQRGTGPTEAFRAYLFTVVRRVASVRRDASRRTQPTDDVAVLEAGALPEADAAEPALAGLERGLVARAFATLPERWQAVLWHSEVEGLQPAQIAPLLGLTANSTAALAYRAREGLRQAYLQQHLNEPLADECRAVSGKLGGYVRRGLGARDTRAVEAHLDECGRCRGLVLELGDVSHGMHGVVAPLVLGLAGLGALGHTLPVGGGLAAGTASLAAGATGGGATGGAAGSAASSGAAGGGAAGGGAAGSAGAAAGSSGAAMGTGVVGAAGAGTAAAGALGSASAAGVGGVLAGAGGLLAALPTALVAGVAAVAVAAAGVVGVVHVLSSSTGDRPSAVGAAGPVSGDGGGAGGSGGSSGGPDASGPTATPDPAPSPAPPDAAALPSVIDGPSTALLPGSSGTSSGSTSGTGTGTSGTTPSGSGAGPGPEPRSEPTQPAVQPTPPLLGVQAPGTFDLTAGSSGALAVDVVNAGDSPATGVVADVSLPAGVVLAAVDTGALTSVSGRFAPLTAVGWLCATVDGGVRCTLDQLPGHTQLRLTLTVQVPEEYTAEGGTVAWTLRGAGLQAVSSSAPLHVAPSPARLVAGGSVADVRLTTGRTTQVTVPVRNTGGTSTSPAAPAVVDVTLPAGVAYASSASPWTCTASGGAAAVHCTGPTVPAHVSTTLTLGLTGTAARTDPGTVTLTLGPTAGRAAAVMDFRVTVVDPEPPATRPVLHLAPDDPRTVMTGRTGTVELTVGVGDPTSGAEQLDASWVTAIVVLPPGLRWTAGAVAVGNGWCVSTFDRVATCVLGHVAAGSSVRVLLPVSGEPAIGANVGVTLTALGAKTVTATRPVVAG